MVMSENEDDALYYLLDNVSIKFCSKYIDKLVFQWVLIGAPLIADLFLSCYKKDFMLSLSDNNQTDVFKPQDI